MRYPLRQVRPLEERFWEKVKVGEAEECWLWTASCNLQGYGQINLGRKGDGISLAHRLAWELVRGPIPNVISVCHRCDTPLCVNPNHLFLGTHADNSADMVSKGRQPCGERNGHAILTELDVKTIWRLLAKGVTHRAIAAMYGVGPSTIYDIKSERNWRYLTSQLSARDALEDQGSRRGEKHFLAKLAETDVKTIWSLLAGGVRVSAIATMFGVRASTIYAIKDGRSWKHITRSLMERPANEEINVL